MALNKLSDKLYCFCKRYVDKHNGENNCDIHTNGEMHFLRKALVDSKIVFDIGANTGEWIKIALSINPNLIIHCFEPSKATFQQLLANSFNQQVTCNNFGFSSEEHETQLKIFSDGSKMNSLYRRCGLEEGWGFSPQTKTETVKLDTLDSYCHKHNINKVDFLKLDVEGHELEVLRGAKDILSKGMVKMIQFEYGGCNIDSRVLLKDFFDLFSRHNYALYKIFPKDIKRFERYDQRLENFQYQNWVAVSNGTEIGK